MTPAPAPPAADDVPLAVCRVEDSVAVHLLPAGTAVVPGVRALCGGVVVPGRPERLLVRNPCARCVREGQARGSRTVRDRTAAWVNLGRLAVTLRTAA